MKIVSIRDKKCLNHSQVSLPEIFRRALPSLSYAIFPGIPRYIAVEIVSLFSLSFIKTFDYHPGSQYAFLVGHFSVNRYVNEIIRFSLFY